MAMNPQMAHPQQAHGGGAQQQGFYPNQVPQQPLSAGQQRQMPNAQQKGVPGQQQTQNSSSNYDPHLALWSLEKQKPTDTWGEVKPQQQFVSLEELDEEITKFKRDDLTAKRVLDKIESPKCRKLINTLADDQTKELQKLNRGLRYIIGGILLENRYVDRRKKEKYLKRVQVILQTVPSGLLDPNKTGASSVQGGQDSSKSMKQAGVLNGQTQNGNLQGQGPNMVQQQRPMQQQQGQQPMAQNQHFDPRLPPPPNGQGQMPHGGNGPPPPPPPPGHHAHAQGGGHAPPPPPPPNHSQHQHGRPQQHMHDMPGTYPGTPVNGMRAGQPGVRIMHDHNSKHKMRHGQFSDDDWDTEASSGSGSWRAHSVSDDFAYIEDRGRRRSKPSKQTKNFLHRSKSRSKSRVASRNNSQHRRKTSKSRRNSTSSEDRARRYSSASSHVKSPYNSSSDESRRGKKYDRWVRPSPTRAYNIRTTERFGTSSPMSRHSSQDSWTDATSSVISDERDRRERGQDHTRKHSRHRSHHIKPSFKVYDNLTHNNARGIYRTDDYPHNPLPHRARESRYDEVGLGNGRPMPQRAATLPQMPMFDGVDASLRQGLGLQNHRYAYPHQAQDYVSGNLYTQQPQNYMPNTAQAVPNRFSMEELSALLDQLNMNKQHSSVGQNRYTVDELSVLLSQLNNDRQRVSSGQARVTMEELVALLDQLNNQRQYNSEARMPLRRNNTERLSTGYFGHQNESQRRQGYLDDEFSDARYAARGAAYGR